MVPMPTVGTLRFPMVVVSGVFELKAVLVVVVGLYPKSRIPSKKSRAAGLATELRFDLVVVIVVVGLCLSCGRSRLSVFVDRVRNVTQRRAAVCGEGMMTV
jgi:hypothetical protein